MFELYYLYMKYTNINIIDDDKRFQYILEYVDNAENNVSSNLSYVEDRDGLRIDFFQVGAPEYQRFNNYWKLYEGASHEHSHLPQHYNLSSVNVYFPNSSVETYSNNNLYMLTVNTWVHGHIVYLGTYLLDRSKALACKRETKFLNRQYYEYVNVKFIDPYYLIYADEWKEFRQQICGEDERDDYEQNNTGSVLNFTLYPVTESELGYVKLDPYIGGQNAINISDEVSDYIGTNIKLNDERDRYGVLANLSFNRDYCSGEKQMLSDLKQYLRETYDINDRLALDYELVVMDDDNIYKVVTKNIEELEEDQDISHLFTRNDLAFSNWRGWKEGLYFSLSVMISTIYTNEDDEEVKEEVLLLRSNTISITQDVMKFFIISDPNIPQSINLDEVDMNNYNINAVNKVEKKIIQLDRPDNNKGNLIKPVYFRARELNELVVHPNVTENISFNLDAYKSQVERFFLQIDGVVFPEFARVASGVIFRIVGADLPYSTNEEGNRISEGVLYLLNQDKELITTGKYRYEV